MQHSKKSCATSEKIYNEWPATAAAGCHEVEKF